MPRLLDKKYLKAKDKTEIKGRKRKFRRINVPNGSVEEIQEKHGISESVLKADLQRR